MRFTPDGGKVEIELRSQTGFAEIDIGDNGPGIPQADISKLFDHGYSVRSSMHHASADGAKAPASGLGLGLGITRGIIEAHGGTIEAGNRPEGGARFTIRLPLGARAKKAA
jgi:signal transduction histidine kinase